MEKSSNKSLRIVLIQGIFALIALVTICISLNTHAKMNGQHKFSSATVAFAEDQTQSISPAAKELLRVAMDYLSKLNQFSVEAQSTYEDLLESGHRVDFELSSSVTISRPDKLHSERHGISINQLFYYNGKDLTLYNPYDKVYATESAPGTIEEMFHFARDNFGIGAPVADILYDNAYALLMYEVDYAEVIGIEMIGTVRCNHLLFSRPGVDFQIWVAAKGAPLPYKYVVTDTATPELLSVTTYMSNWNTSPAISDDLFSFTPPQGTQKIEFLKAE